MVSPVARLFPRRMIDSRLACLMAQRLNIPELADRVEVFADRAHGGRVLAELIRPVAILEPLLLAIPAGGVPMAVAQRRARNASSATAISGSRNG
jgi:hypothetical protein